MAVGGIKAAFQMNQKKFLMKGRKGSFNVLDEIIREIDWAGVDIDEFLDFTQFWI